MEEGKASTYEFWEGTHIQSLRPSICKSARAILPTSYTNFTGGTLTHPSSFTISASHVGLPSSEPSPDFVWWCGSHPRTREEVAWGEGRILVLHSCCSHSSWNKEKDLKVPSVNHLAPFIPFLPCLPHLASPLPSSLPPSASSLYYVSLKGQPPGPAASAPSSGAGRMYKLLK